jgi:hypothetical protein
VGEVLKKGDIVVYESTVYPGATEEDCVPVLEQVMPAPKILRIADWRRMARRRIIDQCLECEPDRGHC